jgi:Tfp pilus assembly protein PilE
MNNKGLIKALVVVGVLAVIVSTFFYNDSQKNNKTVLEQAQEQGERTVALNGTVVRRTEDTIYFDTGYMKQEASGNKFVNQEKAVKVTSSTEILKADEVTEFNFNEIFTGAVLTVYIPIDSIESEEVVATKITVTRQ